ncbi:MAG TPA: M48 family metalloprotease [Alphaproteobacteria bacterium]|nr:hypothetical protein [Rhodospirillaceae bacterium]HRJ11765.1 M48 family metalloprotease [Alphaproteobacteria bacterium]
MRVLRIILAVIIFSFSSVPAFAAERVLRDTETENFLHEKSEPIFRAAGLTPSNIQFILIEDDTMNAFVAGGQNIFLYSGLILRTENLAELLGVIAHETGHIAGGHLLRMEGIIESASRESILLTLLGIAAAALSGNGQVGAATALIGNQTTLSRVLAHSRSSEDSADQAAIKYLIQAKLPAHGLTSFMGKLIDEELLPASRQDEYIQTHPLTRDRFESLMRGTKNLPEIATPAADAEAYERIKAKLQGYIKPRQMVRDRKGDDIPSRYGRAVAYYRLNDMAGALKILDSLQKDEPDNPYFYELRAQILYERGKISEAVTYYQKAHAALPNAPLITLSYGQALLANNDLKAAISILQRAVTQETDSAGAHRSLGIAYGRIGETDLAQLELAETALLTLDYKAAEYHAKAAKFPAGNPNALRAADILALARQKIEEKKKDKTSRQ